MMKHSTPLFLGFILAFLISLSSCRSIKSLEYKDFKNYKFEKLGVSNSVLKVDLVYYNPNNFGLQLKNTDLDVYIDNNYLGHSAQNFQIKIPKKDNFTLPLELTVDMKNIFKNAIKAVSGKEVSIRVEGKVKVGKANIFKTFPVKYETRQKISIF